MSGTNQANKPKIDPLNRSTVKGNSRNTGDNIPLSSNSSQPSGQKNIAFTSHTSGVKVFSPKQKI